MPRARVYVVWKGREPGIYRDWERCRAQVDGFSGAQYRSFASEADAERAWLEAGGEPAAAAEEGEDEDELVDDPDPLDSFEPHELPGNGAPAPGVRRDGPPPGSIAVDAACSGNPGAPNARATRSMAEGAAEAVVGGNPARARGARVLEVLVGVLVGDER